MTAPAFPGPLASRDAAESRFARSVVARLSEHAGAAQPDIDTRLRFAREQALESLRRARSGDVASPLGAGGAATLGFSRSAWWLRLASVLPLAVLIGGLVLIDARETEQQISVAAEVDTALLGDDLPINAYRDAGFAEFLKAPPHE